MANQAPDYSGFDEKAINDDLKFISTVKEIQEHLASIRTLLSSLGTVHAPTFLLLFKFVRNRFGGRFEHNQEALFGSPSICQEGSGKFKIAVDPRYYFTVQDHNTRHEIHPLFCVVWMAMEYPHSSINVT